jgi:hypothetical protein
MTRTRQYAKISLVLGIISVIALLPIHLALTDIWHGEGDVTMEWSVVRFGILAIATFQIAALLTLVNVLRNGERG